MAKPTGPNGRQEAPRDWVDDRLQAAGLSLEEPIPGHRGDGRQRDLLLEKNSLSGLSVRMERLSDVFCLRYHCALFALLPLRTKFLRFQPALPGQYKAPTESLCRIIQKCRLVESQECVRSLMHTYAYDIDTWASHMLLTTAAGGSTKQAIELRQKWFIVESASEELLIYLRDTALNPDTWALPNIEQIILKIMVLDRLFDANALDPGDELLIPVDTDRRGGPTWHRLIHKHSPLVSVGSLSWPWVLDTYVGALATQDLNPIGAEEDRAMQLLDLALHDSMKTRVSKAGTNIFSATSSCVYIVKSRGDPSPLTCVQYSCQSAYVLTSNPR